MDDQKVHVYVPSMDGEFVPVTFTSPEKDFKDSEVLIFLDEEGRQIFIWTGSNSSVRKRFISSQIARQMRMERGMTHRVSTEDQGNETEKFRSFLESIKGTDIKPKSLLDVSPPAISTDLPDPKPREIVTHPSTLKKVDSIKPKAKAGPQSVPVHKPVPEKISEQLSSTKLEKPKFEKNYFCAEEKTAVNEDKAKILFPATNQNSNLSTLHISSASTEGRIAIYSVPKKSKTTSCKSKNPIFVIYLKESTNSILELDDLSIPIQNGNSIYFTCPAKTFIGVNLES